MKILIIGAGPAGSSCAISLLKAGHEVTLIDRANFPRPAPGETLHPGIEPLLQQLGVSNILKNGSFLRHDGIESIIKSKSEFNSYNAEEGWKGFQLNREDFDNQLLNEAIDSGANFHSNTFISSINRIQEVINSVMINNEILEVDFVVDATGKRAWLAHEMGIIYNQIGPKKIAYYGYVQGSRFNPKNPIIEWDENGWTWIAQVKEDTTAWVRLDLDYLRKLKKDWVPTQLIDGEPNETRKAVDVTWRTAQKSSFANCFLVGDAAFVLDPGSSHGVLKAIMSGMMASHLIQKIKSHPIDEIHEHYNSWMNDQFNHDCEKLSEMYKKYKIKTKR